MLNTSSLKSWLIKVKANPKFKSLVSKSNWINIAVLTLSIYFVWNTVLAMRHNQKLDLKFNVLTQKAALLEEANKNLELQKNYYSSKEFQTKALKSKFNLTSEGEKVIIVKDLPAPTNQKKSVFVQLQELDRLLEQN
jgi:hypothetical protein